LPCAQIACEPSTRLARGSALAVLHAILHDEVRAARVVAAHGLDEREATFAKQRNEGRGLRMKTVEVVDGDGVTNAERGARTKVRVVGVRNEEVQRVCAAAEKNAHEHVSTSGMRVKRGRAR